MATIKRNVNARELSREICAQTDRQTDGHRQIETQTERQTHSKGERVIDPVCSSSDNPTPGSASLTLPSSSHSFLALLSSPLPANPFLALSPPNTLRKSLFSINRRRHSPVNAPIIPRILRPSILSPSSLLQLLRVLPFLSTSSSVYKSSHPTPLCLTVSPSPSSIYRLCSLAFSF